MIDYLGYLNQVLDTPEKQEYDWLSILQCIWTLGNKEELTKEDKEVLEKASNFYGNVKLAYMYDGPHSAPPDEMIRRVAHRLLSKANDIKEECNE